MSEKRRHPHDTGTRSVRTTRRGSTTRAGATVTSLTGTGMARRVRLLRATRRARSQTLRTLGRARDWVMATVTGPGRAVACVAVLGPLLGLWLGWVEAVFMGVAALVFAGIAALFMIGRSVYSVELDLHSPRVVVGEDAPGAVLIRNPTRRRLMPESIEIPVGEGRAEFRLPSLAAGGEFRGEFRVPTVRRSVITVGPVRSVRQDPLHLLRRELMWTAGATLFVHPVTIPVPSTSTGLIRDLEGMPSGDLTESDISFHALREYVPGDDRRHIHWKSTARTGTMMVRQFEQTRRSQLLIALTCDSADYFSEEEFELAVSVAASLGVRAIRDGRDTTVLYSGEQPEYAASPPHAEHARSTSPSRLLDDLSGVGHSAASIGLQVLTRVSMTEVPDVSVAFLVCGSVPTLTQIRSAALAFPLGTEIVALVCNPGVVPTVRHVDNLTVLSIGYLDDLKNSLSRAAGK